VELGEIAQSRQSWYWRRYNSIFETYIVTFGKHFFVYVFLEKLFGMIQLGKISDLILKELLTWYEQYPDPRKPNP